MLLVNAVNTIIITTVTPCTSFDTAPFMKWLSNAADHFESYITSGVSCQHRATAFVVLMRAFTQ